MAPAMPGGGGGGGSGTAQASASGSATTAPGARPRRDTLDAPKSRLQRVLLKSVPLRFPFSAPRSGSGSRGGGGLSGQQHFGTSGEAGALPVRVRPAFILLNVLVLTVLGLLGFHPHAQEYVAINDKALHFLGFFLATFVFYAIFDVDESARRIWFWRHFPLLLAGLACFVCGSVGSEFVQALLPYKTFQWRDVLANMLGSALGLFLSYHAERRYRARRELERLYQPLDADDDDDEDLFAVELDFGIGEEEEDDDGEQEARGKHPGRGAAHRTLELDDHGDDTGSRSRSEERHQQEPGKENTRSPSR